DPGTARRPPDPRARLIERAKHRPLDDAGANLIAARDVRRRGHLVNGAVHHRIASRLLLLYDGETMSESCPQCGATIPDGGAPPPGGPPPPAPPPGVLRGGGELGGVAG